MKTYIVTFKPETTDSEIQRAKDDIVAKGGSIEHEYTLIRGFSAKMPDGPAISALEASPHVENMEMDQEVTTQ
ncbi:uncharacterized protein LAJ45_00576 [Morchella importuna]|uniref:Peptidase inhibitor I9 n=1 Tax=Morchella conica CCBAS932 TaxID=1392247 RepID=A0A3N4L6Y7_9PEZI|nr:uncharacterized protein LAJ45_00576 [Morchella importuna]KAH8155566.1 hypothetical protein LAJ45_00576 [Morchella importuna]RPB16401.1 peptidase inhibitor I9 [Morchella conica CCBAS932]